MESFLEQEAAWGVCKDPVPMALLFPHPALCVLSAELGSFCPMQLCTCDRKLVHCLKRNLWSYNPHYQYYPNFFCT